jgi:two-component system chemotaxis response regulator CheB
MIRLLIVDDSAFARYSINRLVSVDPEIEVVGAAKDGAEALEKTGQLHPDVITLDIEMPRMNGLEALQKIMAEQPTPVLVVSSLTGEGSDTTIKALELGAVDFFLKSSPSCPTGYYGAESRLLDKIRLAARLDKNKLGSHGGKVPVKKALTTNRQASRDSPRNIVAIASSTGGPGALYELIPHLSQGIPAALLVVQHMPPAFTRSLADRLNDLSQLSVKEAQGGDYIREGQVLVAPGGFHMAVESGYKVSLNKDPPILGLRPAADVMLSSVARLYGRDTICVVLTGMGSDGTRGATLIKAAGGRVIAQDEASCVVYGMPRSVVEAGAADEILPLASIAAEVGRLCLN